MLKIVLSFTLVALVLRASALPQYGGQYGYGYAQASAAPEQNWESRAFDYTKFVPVVGFVHGLGRSVGYAIAGDDRETTRSATGMLQNLSTTGLAVAGGVFGGPFGAVAGGAAGAGMSFGIDQINNTYDNKREQNEARERQYHQG